MSSSDRIIFLTGGYNFSAENQINELPFRNRITITNLISLGNGGDRITPSTFTLESTTDYQDLYVDFTTSGLHFKAPSKNMLIRVDQSRLDLTKKIISRLSMRYDCANLNGTTSKVNHILLSSEFIEYSTTDGTIIYLHCIPERYYIKVVSMMYIAADVPAGDLTLDFYQFD